MKMAESCANQPRPAPFGRAKAVTPAAVGGRFALLGLLTRKERWALSFRGWLLLVVCFTGASALLLLTVHPFLAITDRRKTDTLVVEGWIHEYAIRAAAEEFKRGGYRRVFSTGGPVQGLGAYTNEFNTSASVGADRLKAAGIPATLVVMVPSRVTERDRTYSAAVALRRWLEQDEDSVRSLNVVTEGVHARRSRLLFEKAFGETAEIGVIAVTNPGYRAERWWQYSEGVKEVISEGAAYLYARFFFHPADQP